MSPEDHLQWLVVARRVEEPGVHRLGSHARIEYLPPGELPDIVHGDRITVLSDEFTQFLFRFLVVWSSGFNDYAVAGRGTGIVVLCLEPPGTRHDRYER